MFDLSQIQNDVDAVNGGAWKTLSGVVGGVSWAFDVKLRSELSEEYLEAETRIFTELREKHGENAGPRDRIAAKLRSIVEGALVDWRNLELDGQKFLFTQENAERLFLTPEFQHVGEKLLFAFQSSEEFLKKRQAAREKNFAIASSST